MDYGLSDKSVRAAGFTLIELVIAMAIVAILATIAYPSYKEQVSKSRRADTMAVLMEAAQFMERFYTENGNYSTDTGGVPVALPANLQQSPKDGATKYYNLSLAAVAANSYTLQSVPIASGPQNGDRCGTFTLTNTGAKGAAQTDCWRR